MSLYKRIEDDMKAALKKGETLRLSVLRMLVSAVRMLEIEKNLKTVEDSDCIQIVQRQIKQHKESIDQFRKGNRQDLVDKESRELEILESYMPKSLSEEEVASIVKEAIRETGAVTRQDMGKVMKAVMEKVKGHADGKLVNGLVMSMLK